MTIRCANRDLVNFAVRHLAAEGYGNMSVEVSPWGSGILPRKLTSLFHSRVNSRAISTVVYSYGTPIAWFDTEYKTWVEPFVNYSITTSKHQGYLWKLSAHTIVFDTPLDEYHRVLNGDMRYARTSKGFITVPGWRAYA